MNEHIHPVVADTPCAECGARQWKRVGTKDSRGCTIETYECVNAMCLGLLHPTRGREPWPLSWAHEGAPT